MVSPTLDRRQGLVGNTPMKAPVDLATTGPITLNGEQIIDGVMTSGSRVLVKDQADQTTNGIYDTNTANWTLAQDSDGNYDLAQGTLVLVNGGSTNANAMYSITSPNPLPGSTSIVWRVLNSLLNLASAIGASLVGYLRAAVGAVLRTLQSKSDDTFSAMDFMTAAQIADVRGGTLAQDVTAACQAAINACPVGGNMVWPAGRYKLTAPLRIPAPINMIGAGAGSAYNDNGTYIVQTSTGVNAFTMVAAVANFAFDQYGIVGVNFRDMCIEGPGITTPAADGIGVDTTVNDGVFHIRENTLTNVTIKYFQVGVAHTGIAYLNKFFNCQFIENITGYQALQGASGTAGGQTRFFGCTFDLLPTLSAAGQGVGLSWLTDAEGGDLTVIGCTFADGYRGIVCNDYTNLVVMGCHFENLQAAHSYAGTTALSGAGIYIPTLSSKANPVSGSCKTILGNNFNNNDQSIWINNQSSGLGAGTTTSFYPALIDANSSSDVPFLNVTAPAGVYGFTGPEFRFGRSNSNQASGPALSASQVVGLFQSMSDERKFRFTRKYSIPTTYTSGSTIDILPAGLVVTSVRMYLTANATGFSQFELGDQASATRYLSFNAQSQALNTWVSYAESVPPFVVAAGVNDRFNLIGTGGILSAAGVIELDGYVA